MLGGGGWAAAKRLGGRSLSAMQRRQARGLGSAANSQRLLQTDGASLEEPVREQRWFARMKAFSEDAESKVPEGFSQREAVEKLLAALPPLGDDEGTAG